MLVHDLRCGKRYAPHHMVTIKDLLRLIVEEERRKHSTKVSVTLAFNNISILPREPWLAAAARFGQFYRAFTVDPAFPYASEEAYFWSQLPVDQLVHLQTKLIELCIPSDYRPYCEEGAAQRPQGVVRAGFGIDVHSQDTSETFSAQGCRAFHALQQNSDNHARRHIIVPV